MWQPTIDSLYLCHSFWTPTDELYHHGILGMKWGKKNGPPYPLGSEDHSASEKKAGWKKSLGGGKVSDVNKKKDPLFYTNAGLKEKAKKDPDSLSRDEYRKLAEYEISETDRFISRADALMNKFNNTKTNKLGLKKRDKLRNEWKEEFKRIDKHFDNPEVQKELLEKSEKSIAADVYLTDKTNSVFGDWYFSDYKSDRAKKAYSEYLKEMAKTEPIEKQMREISKKEFDQKNWRSTEEQYTKLHDEKRKIRLNAENKLVKAAMEDIGLDKSVIDDPDMQDKMRHIVIWD